ncbi:2-oxo-4-hydroxy-4-carboxy-5-ureidoimidazoline decarboxylase [Streptomyces spectabilis]|uniref:2-oxo-4-hydroxy-4-carboxy-5-ureidoimidazoline decarboxylase n=1 Tax=Streptomyces spectabilis TaxID=68270 RepID=A0A5P2X9V4_STRST|nr:2-oxo-4-hydroxy-4-carboxy-5-ureidoimidazoline decarboxylase [Streptomyces spectabilis]MCI3904695.1 2-oxo-4-hydroxy-4-carboxy-5-ureidoimidazoline decarboxylase [Streptomyces spectabilis]QEV61767.1 2-oxo-4-hydroxy-4-carboxy-5-ureidoimidazoline decarboxylase [Streptomyces spectabilis]
MPDPAGPPASSGPLEPLNTAPADEAQRTLLTCCGSSHWARKLTAHRPYPDLDALLAAADEAAYDLTPADLTEALAAEPLEPALPPGSAYTAAATALRAAHAAYESRFGHAFVICLDATAPSEALDHLLASLRDRLGNDPEEELAVAADELRRAARARLTRLVHNWPGIAVPSQGRTAEPPRAARSDSPYVPV